jgi:ABC-type Fe3+ transport system permease subunit
MPNVRCAAFSKGRPTVTDKDLGEALLRLDAAQLAGERPDLRQQAAQIVQRDRGRLRALTIITVLAWLAATVLIFADIVAYGFLMPLQAHMQDEEMAKRLPAAERERWTKELPVAFHMATVTIAFSVAALTVAALCTVLLLSASRRATLRQVNANLIEISEQLKHLRQALAERPS